MPKIQSINRDNSRAKKFNLPRYGKKNLNIFILTWRGETEAEHGFFNRLKKLGYEAGYTTFDAGQSTKALINFLSKEFTTDNIDYIYTFGTSVSLLVAEKLRNSKSSVPQVFNVVSSPEKCNLVNNIHNGGNISGIKISVPIDLQIINARNFLKFKKLGVLVSTKDQNCIDTYSQLVECSKKFGFEVQQISVNKNKDLQNVISKLETDRDKYQIDALFITANSLFISNIKEILEVVNELKIPSIAETEKMVAEGALFGTVSNYGMAGEMAADIIAINQFGVQMDYIPLKKCEAYECINFNTLKILGMQCDISCEVYYDNGE
ncbi:MAG: hypothetical protein LBI37_02795 [Puniceicoccales bacterium]|nr:hypothetical protein [Puniceicoccales bacterium]